MVREARFLSDDPGWVDPSRFVDDRDMGETAFEPLSRRRRGRQRRGRDIGRRSDPRRRRDDEKPGDKE